MRKTLIILLLISPFFLSAQESKKVLIPFLQDGKYGFANTAGEITIEPAYDEALPFYDNYELSFIIQGKKPLIIDRKGKVVAKAAPDFFRNNRSELLDNLPKTPKELEIRSFCQLKTCPGFAITEAFDNEKVFDKMNNFYFVSNRKGVFLIDKEGNEMSKTYERIRHYDYIDLDYCITEDISNKRYGLLDANAKEILECVYDEINYLGKGKFLIQQGDFKREIKLTPKTIKEDPRNETQDLDYRVKKVNEKLGVTSKDDRMVVPAEYDLLYPLNNYKFVFWKGNEAGILDTTGQHLFSCNLPFSFSERSNFPNFVVFTIYSKDLVFFNQDKKWCLINLQGQQVGDKYNGIFNDYQNITGTLAGVSIGDKAGAIDENGNYIIQPTYEQIYCLRFDKSFVVKENKKWKWLNAKGETITEGFDDFRYLLKGYLFIQKNGEWFYVDGEGKEFRN